jgi:rhodanese-related sulfurtransferase
MTDIFKGYGIKSNGILNVSPREAFKLVSQGAVIIDVREDYLLSVKAFDVTEVYCFPKSKILEESVTLPFDRFLIFSDSVGLRSKEVVIFLKGKGYKRIANMAGGIVDWERDGLPITTDVNSRLSGSCICQLKPREGKSRK